MYPLNTAINLIKIPVNEKGKYLGTVKRKADRKTGKRDADRKADRKTGGKNSEYRGMYNT